MSHSLSNYSGVIAAWLCLAPVSFAREPLSVPITLAPASTQVHYAANMPLFLVWITGGILLIVRGVWRTRHLISWKAHNGGFVQVDVERGAN
jgi:hypothetical protein